MQYTPTVGRRTVLGASVATTALAALGSSAISEAAAAPARSITPRDSNLPLRGWSSWSLCATTYPGTNPDGRASWLTEANVLAQAEAMAGRLRAHGYEYINIDGGWGSADIDDYGRPKPNMAKFPRGMKAVADDIHAMGLKFGMYYTVGMQPPSYNNGNTPILGAPGQFTRDIVFPDLRKTGGWLAHYAIDFSKPAAQAYIDSLATQFADWGVDFLKLDGVGPGYAAPITGYDNRDDVAAWREALDRTGRDIKLQVSWSLSHDYVDFWREHATSWRIDFDVEPKFPTLVTWDLFVKTRWWDLPQWSEDSRLGHYNDLDALNVGNGEMDGISEDERRSYMTLWAIAGAPLYLGDDLTKLDSFGEKLITNDELLAINDAGRPAVPLDQHTEQPVWFLRLPSNDVVIAMFNLADSPKDVTITFRDVGINGSVRLWDVWAQHSLGARTVGSFSTSIPPHGCRLLRATPLGSRQTRTAVPTRLRATAVDATSINLAWDRVFIPAGSSYDVRVNGQVVVTTTDRSAHIVDLTPGTAPTIEVRAKNGGQTSGWSSAIEIVTTSVGGPTRYEAEHALLTAPAKVADSPLCSNGKKVGYLGKSGTATFEVEVPVAGVHLLTISYIVGTPSRQAFITVNSEPPFLANFAGTSDGLWVTPQLLTIPVALTAGSNVIKFNHPSDGVPDLDFIAI